MIAGPKLLLSGLLSLVVKQLVCLIVFEIITPENGKESHVSQHAWTQQGSELILPGLELRLRSPYVKSAMADLAKDIAERKIQVVVNNAGADWLSLAGEVTPLARLESLVESPQGFRNARLAGAELAYTRYAGVDFSGADLTEADLSFSRGSRTVFDAAEMPEIDGRWITWQSTSIQKSNLCHADFSGANLSNVDFSGCDLSNASFRSACIDGVVFHQANLAGCDFSGARLNHPVFSESEFDESNFSYARIENYRMPPVDLAKANFYGAILNGSRDHGLPKQQPRCSDHEYLKPLKLIARIRDRVRLFGWNDLVYRFAIKMDLLSGKPFFGCFA